MTSHDIAVSYSAFAGESTDLHYYSTGKATLWFCYNRINHEKSLDSSTSLDLHPRCLRTAGGRDTTLSHGYAHLRRADTLC